MSKKCATTCDTFMYDFLEDCSTYLTFMKFILDTDWAKTFEMKENQSIAAKEFVKIRQ
jgi:hypothetical protein